MLLTVYISFLNSGMSRIIQEVVMQIYVVLFVDFMMYILQLFFDLA